MQQKITIYDTTLRDGMQGMGISYTLNDKLSIAHELDAFGIDYIEGGFPLSNEKEAEFFKQIKKEPMHHARVVAFGSTRKPNSRASSDPQILALLEAETPTVIVVGKAWTAHVEHVLKTSLDENLAMIYDSITTLKKEGREVFFDLEHFFDGFKADPEYALKVLSTGREAGADCLVLCDTNGGTLPHKVQEIFLKLKSLGFTKLGVHFHNDTGNAVANSLLAIKEGATHVQGTVNGWGERCGNANLCSIIPTLILKMNYIATCSSQLEHLTSLARFVAEKANIIPDRRQPYVGEAAFTHKAGQHVDVLLKADYLMEHIDPKLVGNTRSIILSELAGKSTIVKKLTKYGSFDKNSEIVTKLTNLLKELEQEGYEYEAAEASFDLIIRRMLGLFKPLFELRNYHLETYKLAEAEPKTVGRVFLQIDGREVMGAAVKVGPVEALDSALRDALEAVHPFIKSIKLIDYRVRVLDPEMASSAKVRVFITTTDGNQEWDTVGVSENIIDASWQALVDSYNYYYNNNIINGNKN